MPFRGWQGEKAFIFLSWLPCLSKKFHHITKDTNDLYFQLGGSHKLSYFSTSTPFKTHLSSPWPTYYKRSIFDMEKLSDLLQAVNFDMKRFWHPIALDISKLQPFSYSFVHFPIYDVFINKVLQGLIKKRAKAKGQRRIVTCERSSREIPKPLRANAYACEPSTIVTFAKSPNPKNRNLKHLDTTNNAHALLFVFFAHLVCSRELRTVRCCAVINPSMELSLDA